MRDFSTISPSARMLLLAKAHSGLPFAKEAAELTFGAEAVAEAATPASFVDAVRRRHFEMRARSVDEGLDLVGATRIIELASGYSLRGLARAIRGDDYLDTDLPDVVEVKSQIVEQLAPASLAGRYRLEPLNALDTQGFMCAVDSLPTGPIAVTHEGLLMYLNPEEKVQLASNIRDALLRRGGAWITADIYIRDRVRVARPEAVERFLAEHRVEEQKFGSWDEAEALFLGAGFTIERRLDPSDSRAAVRQTWIMRVG